MKILVVANNSFSKTENNGKTLCSIFSGFAPEKLAQLYFGVGEAHNEEFCKHYYRVTEIDILKSIYGRTFTTTNSHSELIYNLKNNIRRKESWYYRKIFSKRMRLVREYLWRTKIWDTPELRDWVEGFKPDAIFAMLGSNIYAHTISILLAERYNIPLFIYFTDDYVINSTAKSIVDRVHYRWLRSKYKETVSKAYMSYAIGKKMQQDYSQLFSKPFGILGNSIDMDKYSHLQPKTIEKGESIIISYIGAIHSNRWKTIAALGEIVKEINLKYDYSKIEIKVFSPTEPRKRAMAAFAKSGVEFCGTLDSTGVLNQMEKSHFLLHVESFDKRNRTYVRYSVSTKISEYLSSSRVVLAYGPHEVASMQLLMDNSLGCCLTDLDSKEEIINKICAAIENYNNYDYTSSKQFVLNNYSKDIMTGRLESDLANAINENRNKKKQI
jgi:hypothetical protein